MSYQNGKYNPPANPCKNCGHAKTHHSKFTHEADIRLWEKLPSGTVFCYHTNEEQREKIKALYPHRNEFMGTPGFACGCSVYIPTKLPG